MTIAQTLFSFTVPRTVVVVDLQGACIQYFFTSLILTYIILYQLIYSYGYTDSEIVSGFPHVEAEWTWGPTWDTYDGSLAQNGTPSESIEQAMSSRCRKYLNAESKTCCVNGSSAVLDGVANGDDGFCHKHRSSHMNDLFRYKFDEYNIDEVPQGTGVCPSHCIRSPAGSKEFDEICTILPYCYRPSIGEAINVFGSDLFVTYLRESSFTDGVCYFEPVLPSMNDQEIPTPEAPSTASERAHTCTGSQSNAQTAVRSNAWEEEEETYIEFDREQCEALKCCTHEDSAALPEGGGGHTASESLKFTGLVNTSLGACTGQLPTQFFEETFEDEEEENANGCFDSTLHDTIESNFFTDCLMLAGFFRDEISQGRTPSCMGGLPRNANSEIDWMESLRIQKLCPVTCGTCDDSFQSICHWVPGTCAGELIEYLHVVVQGNAKEIPVNRELCFGYCDHASSEWNGQCCQSNTANVSAMGLCSFFSTPNYTSPPPIHLSKYEDEEENKEHETEEAGQDGEADRSHGRGLGPGSAGGGGQGGGVAGEGGQGGGGEANDNDDGDILAYVCSSKTDLPCAGLTLPKSLPGSCNGTTSHGDTCTFKCEEGYYAPLPATCRYGNWINAACQAYGAPCAEHICTDECLQDGVIYAENSGHEGNGVCEDGGEESWDHRCDFGTDCSDCGWRKPLEEPKFWSRRCDYVYVGAEAVVFEASYPPVSEALIKLTHSATAQTLYPDTTFGLTSNMPAEGVWMLEGDFSEEEIKDRTCAGCDPGVFKMFSHSGDRLTDGIRFDSILIKDLVRSNKELSDIFDEYINGINSGGNGHTRDIKYAPSPQVILSIDYKNYGGFGELWYGNRVEYTYNVRCVARDNVHRFWWLGDRKGFDSEKSIVEHKETGISIIARITGTVKNFSFSKLFLNTVAGLSVLAVASMATRFFMANRCNEKRRNRFRKLHEVHLMTDIHIKHDLIEAERDVYRILTCLWCRSFVGCGSDWEDMDPPGKVSHRKKHTHDCETGTGAKDVSGDGTVTNNNGVDSHKSTNGQCVGASSSDAATVSLDGDNNPMQVRLAEIIRFDSEQGAPDKKRASPSPKKHSHHNRPSTGKKRGKKKKHKKGHGQHQRTAIGTGKDGDIKKRHHHQHNKVVQYLFSQGHK